MILDLTISNFRSFKEPQTISFEATKDMHLNDYYVAEVGPYRVLKLAALFGANASGKSNMLYAFSFFFSLILRPAANKNETIDFDRFALDPDCDENDTQLEVNFICGEVKYNYKISLNNQSINAETLRAQPFGKRVSQLVFDRTTDLTTLTSSVKWGANYRSADNRKLADNLLHNRTVFGAYLTSNVHIQFLSEITDWASEYPLPPVNPDNQNIAKYVSSKALDGLIPEEMLAELTRNADLGINSLSIEKKQLPLPKSLVDSILNDDRAPEKLKEKMASEPYQDVINISMGHIGAEGAVFQLAFEQESFGTRRYYELSGLLIELIKSDRFLTIDELECRLHPDLFVNFITTYLSNACRSQLLFTTHLRELLDDHDLYRDDAIWFTEKSAEGATAVYSLCDFGSELKKKQTDRYLLYKAGRLGATPSIADTIFSAPQPSTRKSDA